MKIIKAYLYEQIEGLQCGQYMILNLHFILKYRLNTNVNEFKFKGKRQKKLEDLNKEDNTEDSDEDVNLIVEPEERNKDKWIYNWTMLFWLKIKES